ncbi:MAG: polysaccharide deacetylase [Nitrospinaceae bacterium]|nr:MAG: polysaccharide deacetylase [Nitrospinaceae bacterium]
MDPLLSMLQEENVPATFFTTGQVAEMYPEKAEKLVSLGHELGSHGFSHKDFTTLDKASAHKDIKKSVDALRQFASVTSFRAPYLKFPDTYLDLLHEEGFHLDSSQAKYKLSYYRKSYASPLRRIPVSMSSSHLRLPEWIRMPYLNALASPVVLYVHPWEFVDWRKTNLRFDCRFKTGPIALDCLRSALRHFKQKNAQFFRMTEL